jgi:hypothetical protein
MIIEKKCILGRNSTSAGEEYIKQKINNKQVSDNNHISGFRYIYTAKNLLYTKSFDTDSKESRKMYALRSSTKSVDVVKNVYAEKIT